MAGKTLSSGRVPVSARASGINFLLKPELLRELAAIAMLLGVAYLILSIASFDAADSAAAAWPANTAPANLGGQIGSALISTSYLYFGVATYLAISLAGVWAAVIFFRRRLQGWQLKLVGAVLAVCAFAGFFGGSHNGSLSMPSSGGVVGAVIFDFLSGNCGLTGTYLILTFLVAASFLLATDVLFYPLVRDLFAPQGEAAADMDAGLEVSFEKVDPDVQFAADAAMAGAVEQSRKGIGGRIVSLLRGPREREDGAGNSVAVEDSDDAAAIAELCDASRSSATSVLDKEEEDEDCGEDAQDAASAGGTPAVHDVKIGAAKPLVKAMPAPAPAKPKKPAINPEIERKAQLAEITAYRSPSAELLERGRKSDSTRARKEISANAQVIADTLKHFAIDIEVIDIKRGPTISMYELKAPPALPIKKIVSREAELTMMLQAQQIRILAPIPGKDTIGVEVPNRIRDMVTLREVVASQRFIEAARTMQLPIALGLDSVGEPLVRDLAKAPHLLIAGTTGSGKSVMQNVILMSLLLTRHYRDVRMVLVDPKCVELTPYHDTSFLATPVITDMSKAVVAFEWLVAEMENRYDLFAKTRTKKITEFNSLPHAERVRRVEEQGGDPDAVPEHMPYIVAMVDELADMMMASQDTRVDELICRIAQKARAAGMHLILATQRPSADVVTGLIKANVPARIGFKLPTAIDSRTIIASQGAEKLMGQGDMLLDWNDGKGLMRAQSAFCDSPEIERVCEEIRKQASPRFLVKPKHLKTANPDDNMIGGQPRHEKLDEAIQSVLETGRASAQYLRSALRIGYNAATTIIMQMEMLGILGPARGSKERDILMTAEQWQTLNAPVDDEDEDEE